MYASGSRRKPSIKVFIDRMHKWRPNKYTLVSVLIRPTSLVLKELFFCILSALTWLVRLISTKRKKIIAIYAFGLYGSLNFASVMGEVGDLRIGP